MIPSPWFRFDGSGPFALTVVLSGLLMGCNRETVPPAPPTPPGARQTTITTAEGLTLALIPAGEFVMGDNDGDEDEKPAHTVRVGAFYIDTHEVTQKAYAGLMEKNPSKFKDPSKPVEQVDWYHAVLYCNLRSRKENLVPCYDPKTLACDFTASGYRLPTEAEWEYACRAGTETDYSFGGDARPLKDYAWFAENAAKQTHPVRAKKPNAWGLFDMYGNVAEWCNDIYEKDYYRKGPSKNPRGPEDGEKYVLRGGAWNSTAQACRSAYRVGEDPGFQDACFARDAIGFRCVRAVRNASTAPGAR
jgi:formylglycine-generating enzyme required for sulfatase activity